MYTTDEIAAALKEARKAKGLSQSALGAKIGLTQKHISKIESASINVGLSNLLELARALELELMLVPRKAVPAAQGLVRTVEANATPSIKPDKSFRQLAEAAERIRMLVPDAKEVQRLKELAKTFQNFRLTSEQYQTMQNAARQLQQISHILPKVRNSQAWEDELQRVRLLTNQLQQTRNAIVHGMSTQNPSPAKPAYQLDDDGDLDG